MTDNELVQLSFRQLIAINGQIEAAIRAAIRAKQASKSTHSAGEQTTALVTPVDLERERDAWLAGRKSR